jgi:3-methyladenine DNA glycosylase Tag
VQPPKQIDAEGGADYLEVISKAVFQSGMSWAIVNNKWDGFTEAFAGFEPELVASFGNEDVERLAADASIIRNRRKIEATIHNAQAVIAAEDECGDFRAFLRSHDDFEDTVKDLRKRFKFLGEFGCFYFLYVVKEEVPAYEDWAASRGVEPVALG